MAAKKSPAKKTPKKTGNNKQNRKPVPIMLWVFIFILPIAAFFILLAPVLIDKMDKSKAEKIQEQISEQQLFPEPQLPQQPFVPVEQPATQEQTFQQTIPQEQTVTQQQTTPQTEPVTQQPVTQTPLTQQPLTQPPVTQTVETRERSIYFMQDKGSGSDLVLIRVNRSLKVSDSPLLDSINALLIGPTADEKRNSLVSFIPDNTRIMSALVRGSTAYLDFNAEFRYNTMGREGFAAQLQQIVWTATEFSNVNDVQILIEGKRVDFLSEGVIIGSPIGR